MTPLIKNCGLKTEPDVHAAISSGASFLGFVIHPASPRHVSAHDAAALCRDVPAHVKSVAVIVDPSDEMLRQLFTQWRPHLLQLHGGESPARMNTIKQQSGLQIIKAIGVAEAADVEQAHDYQDLADMLLFDTKHLDLPGGSGVSFDWGLVARREWPVPWFLSGGLHTDNVAEALRITRAPMVDVSSGIEASRGVKDAQKIAAFNETVRQCRL